MTAAGIESGRPYRQMDLATGEKQTVSFRSIWSQIETRQAAEKGRTEQVMREREKLITTQFDSNMAKPDPGCRAS